MRKLVVVTIVLVVLLLGALGFASYNANSLIAKYKPDLESALGSSLGSTVEIGAINVSIFPRTSLVIDSLTLTPPEGGDAALALKNLSLKLRLLPLLQKRLSISELVLDQPTLTIIRDQAGFRLAGIGKSTFPSAPASTEAAAPPTTPIAINLDRFALESAVIRLDDRLSNTVRETTVTIRSAFELSDSTFTLTNCEVQGNALGLVPFSSSADLAIATKTKELTINQLVTTIFGSSISVAGKLDPSNHNGELKLSSSGLELGKFAPLVQATAPAVAAMKFVGIVTPNINVTLRQPNQYQSSGEIALQDLGATFGPLVISELSGNLQVAAKETTKSLSGAKLPLKINGAPLTVSFAGEMVNQSLSLKEYDLEGLGGKAKGSATLELDQIKRFTEKVSANGLDVAALKSTFAPGVPVTLTGTLETFDGDFAGTFSGDIKKSVTGSGSVVLKDGELKEVGLVAEVMKAVKALPFLSGGSLYDSAPADERAQISAETTKIKSLTGSFSLANARASTRNLNLVSDIFTLEGAGSIGFDMSLDLTTSFIFNKDYSTKLVAKTKELKYLQDSEGRVVLPLALSGTLPKVVVLPDLEKILKLTAGEALRDKAGKALGNLLGDKKKDGGLMKGLGF